MSANEGTERTVTLKGTRAQVDMAETIISAQVKQALKDAENGTGPSQREPIPAGSVTKTMNVASQHIGALIGKGFCDKGYSSNVKLQSEYPGQF